MTHDDDIAQSMTDLRSRMHELTASMLATWRLAVDREDEASVEALAVAGNALLRAERALVPGLIGATTALNVLPMPCGQPRTGCPYADVVVHEHP